MSESIPKPNAEKWVSYAARAPYTTLNARGEATRRTWVVFHGIGYLSRYFLRHFSGLDPQVHYLIAPQAPSLYYLSDTYTHVGASWLTREHTQGHMDNLMEYLDSVLREEGIQPRDALDYFAYSQGVSVLCRWLARRPVGGGRIFLYAGKPPAELRPEAFSHLPETMPVVVVFGNQDPFLKPEDRPGLLARYRELFGDRLQVVAFDGGHELRNDLIVQLAAEYGNT